MKPGMTLKMIIEQQKTWASTKGIAFETSGRWNGYVHSLTDNLFCQRLSERTSFEFRAGQGNELKSNMKALYSSSALAVNIFEHWRQDERILEVAQACGVSHHTTDMEFEKKHKIANLGTPNLDIEFSGEKPFAIEAKFTEPYRRTTQRNDTSLDKYLSQARLWEGLPGCKKLAQEVFEQEGKTTSWKHLDVPQLIKHVLGLSYKYTPNCFILLYLWYDCDNDESRELGEEIHHFRNTVRNEIGIKSMTYQELFRNLSDIPNVDSKYLAYLNGRYFK